MVCAFPTPLHGIAPCQLQCLLEISPRTSHTHYEITPLAFALHFCECVFVPWCVYVEIPGPCFMSPAKHTRQAGLWASEDSSVSLCLPISLWDHWGYRCGLHCVGLHGIWGSQLSASRLCHAVFACWAHSQELTLEALKAVHGEMGTIFLLWLIWDD